MAIVRSSLLLVAPRAVAVRRVLIRAAPELLLMEAATVGDALHTLRTARPRVLLCEPHDARGQATDQLLEAVAADFSTVGLVGLVPSTPPDTASIIQLVRSGAHSILVADDRLTSLECRRVLTEATVRSAVSVARSELLRVAPTIARPLVEHGLKYANAPLCVARVSQALRVHRKTLFWWCAEAHIPAPQQILGWCRLLAAASLLEDHGRKVDHVALDLEFPSGTALRNLMHRYCAMSPSALRACGPVREITIRFRASLLSSV